MDSNENGRGRVLTALVLANVLLLVVQYALGMYVNLFVQFPDSLPQGNGWSWVFSNSSVTVAHIALGTTIALLSIVLLGLSIAHRRALITASSALGLLMVLFAWWSGSDFLSRGQRDVSSYTMAIGFVGAIVFYIWQIILLFRHRTASKG
jgi:hypothetical protein